MSKSKYSVQILVDGKPVKEYTKDNKTFIEAKSGTEYTVRVKNNSASRAVAIVSIDGVNTITGEIAKPDSTGYVIQAFNSIEVKGYRQDQSGGGRFKFTEKESGYSKEIDGTGINSGVIGVYLVAEKYKPKVNFAALIPNKKEEDYHYPFKPRPSSPFRPQPTFPWRNDDIWCHTRVGGSSSAIGSSDARDEYSKGTIKGDVIRGCSKSSNNSQSPIMQNYCAVVDSDALQGTYSSTMNSVAEAPVFDRATTWGSKFEEVVEYVDFERSNDSETLNVYYVSRDSLKNQGIINDNPHQVTSFPQSFPTFAKPPAGWKS